MHRRTLVSLVSILVFLWMIAPNYQSLAAQSVASQAEDVVSMSFEEASAYMAELSPDEQWAIGEAIVADLSVTWEIVDEGGEEVSLASSCGTKQARGSYSSFGVLQFRMFSSTYWCWNGSTVWGGVSKGTYGETHYMGWQYVSEGGYPWMTMENWGTAIYKDAHAYFRLCYAACVQHVYPWIKSYGEEDGTLNWDQSGW